MVKFDESINARDFSAVKITLPKGRNRALEKACNNMINVFGKALPQLRALVQKHD